MLAIGFFLVALVSAIVPKVHAANAQRVASVEPSIARRNPPNLLREGAAMALAENIVVPKIPPHRERGAVPNFGSLGFGVWQSSVVFDYRSDHAVHLPIQIGAAANVFRQGKFEAFWDRHW